MAHIKVLASVLLVCSISAHAFPADAPVGGQGAFQGFRPVEPSDAFAPTGPPQPVGTFSQQNPEIDSYNVNRFVRDDSHEQAHERSSTSSEATTAAPHRREATTVVYKRPLANAPTTAAVHVHARRDESGHGATFKPVVLPGSIAATTASSKDRREATTVRAYSTVKASTAADKDKREATTVKFATVPFNRPTTEQPAKRPINKRDEGSQVPSSGSKPLTTSAPKTKRDEGSQVPTSRPSAGSKPLTTPAPKDKRDEGSKVPNKESRPLTTTAPKDKRDAGSKETKPLTTVAPKSKREEPTSRPSAGSKPLTTPAPKNRREEPTSRPSAGSKPLTTPGPKDKREEPKTVKPLSVTSAPLKPLSSATTIRNKRDTPTVPELRPLLTSEASSSTTEKQSFISISHKVKRQAPLSASSEDNQPDQDNRQLFNRPTLLPRPSNRPTGFFMRRTTTPSSPATQAATLAVTTVRTTTAQAKFKRDSFPEDDSRPQFETFSGTQNQPGSITHFSGSSVSSNRPSGAASAGSFASSSVGAPFGANPHLTNKRQTDDGGSSSGEDSQESD